MVHCSAGVGRTGTFIALYKLWNDYYNPEVKTLALLPTVVALRSQRCLMVQKSVQYRYGKLFLSSIKVDQTIDKYICYSIQYRYVAKCLSFMVSTEEGDYYEDTEKENNKGRMKNETEGEDFEGDYF